MDVCCNAGFGCIVRPQATAIRVVIEPAAVLKKGLPAVSPGEAVMAAPERSRTAPPETREAVQAEHRAVLRPIAVKEPEDSGLEGPEHEDLMMAGTGSC